MNVCVGQPYFVCGCPWRSKYLIATTPVYYNLIKPSSRPILKDNSTFKCMCVKCVHASHDNERSCFEHSFIKI